MQKRIVNKKPLASKQLVQKKLADMMSEITLGFSGCILAGRSMDEGKDLKIAISLLKEITVKKHLI